MDEPLSNLDAKLRVQMRSEVLRLHRSLDVATLYVTHDQTEDLGVSPSSGPALVADVRLVEVLGSERHVYFSVDPERLHFFDPDTGLAISLPTAVTGRRTPGLSRAVTR
jgi:ABC-type Fe3+/spermidine/putrescine transport system ATPase subunit